jgi:hypothetical protein
LVIRHQIHAAADNRRIELCILKGVRIQIGEGENTVQIRFHERQVTAQMIEETVNTMRKVLGDDQAQISIDIVGANPVDRLLGKELCVLAWAIEGMDFDHIPIAVRNWLALRPEERWWLFGMTAIITTGGVNDGGKGWRLALRHALGDVAQSELFKPRVTQTVLRNTANDDENSTLSLFDFEL